MPKQPGDNKYKKPLPSQNRTPTPLHEILYWPTREMPPPPWPELFKPEYMNERNWDVLAKKLTPVVGYNAAYDIANYVRDYSAKPVHVARRHAERWTGSLALDTPAGYEEWQRQRRTIVAQETMYQAIHDKLLAKGYGASTQVLPAEKAPTISPPRAHPGEGKEPGSHARNLLLRRQTHEGNVKGCPDR